MPLREIFTVFAVLASSLAGLVNPTIGMYGYVWFSLMRPDELSWSSGRYPYAMTIAACILVGNMRNLHRFVPNVVMNPPARACLLMLAPFTISTLLAVDTNAAMGQYTQFLKTSIVLSLLPMLMNKLEDVRRLFILTALSLGFIGLYFGVVGTAKGGIKIVSGVGGAMSDNNLFALAMVMALPFCWYCIQQTPLIALKAVLLAMFFGAIGTVIFAQSRGSILAMGAVLMLIILQSRRRLLLTLLIAGLALPVLLLTWDQVAKRMATLNDPTQDGSAWSRIEHIRGGIAVWRDHPLFGIGPGDENLARIAGGYGLVAGQALHNTPVQVLAHFGAFGLLCWLNLFGSAVFLAWRSTRRMNRIRPDLAGMPRAVLTSLLGFLSGCLVYPRAYFEYGYLFAAYVGCWLLAEKSLLALPSVDRLPVEPMAPPELPPVATAPEPLETQAPDNPVLVRPPRKRRR